jgi:1-carboxybiuret hydrolase
MSQFASDIVSDVRSGKTSASAVVQNALQGIAQLNPELNAFTDVMATRALQRADTIDRSIATGHDPGPLAGVPFAVKNLFDIEGIPTLAGSKINKAHKPAAQNATLITRLEQAGAILIGGLNMGEYAYDFTGENCHYGASRNPHSPDHMSGGSSGGSGTAVASGMVPLSLGSDTNGSIRVPSSFCGLFGLKPTYGRLTRKGTFPFVASLDHLGPMARSTLDLALAYDAMRGHDPDDPASADKPAPPTLPQLTRGIEGLRIRRAGGYFESGAHDEAFAAVDHVAKHLNANSTIDIPGAKEARAAAYIITMAEGAALHLDRLRTHHVDFDPDVRDRLIAGAMIPGSWVVKAQKYRRVFHARMMKLFETCDVILAPSTPCFAPKIGQTTFVIDGEELPVRPNIGLFTQPISFIGLPVVSVPIWLPGAVLPIGVQIIAAPWREDIALRVSAWLENAGAVSAPVAKTENSS